MASWCQPAPVSTVITSDEIATLSAEGNSTETTPVLKLIADARSRGYDSVCVPLTTGAWKDRWAETCILPPDYERSADMSADYRAELWRSNPTFDLGEVAMTRLDEGEGVTVMVSDWLELDAEDEWLRDDYEIALQQELAYASYLNVHAAILPPPRNRAHIASYARAVNECLRNVPFIQLSVRLPIYAPPELRTKASPKRNSTRMASMSSTALLNLAPRLVIPGEGPQRRDGAGGKLSKGVPAELNATWEMWDLIRTMCDYNARLTLTLDLSLPLPSALGVLNRWSAEAVRFIFLPASAFIANAKGYPVLPKGTQAFIRDSMTHHPTVILAGANAGLHACGGEAAYAQYVRHLESTSPALQAAQKTGSVENFAQGYQDYLQAPLQPLMDNLQSVTYQTFEQDPVKYRNYEEAIYRALLDRPAGDRLVLCVAGAGRGPIVARCLLAMEKARRTGLVYAVEKNPNAWVTLQSRKQLEWGSKVELLFGDMRHIDVPEKADILISELLGSFGDNELSPECLDGAMRFLKADGISIPSSYAAHLAPLSSSKLHNEARVGGTDRTLETPYVVMLHAVNILSGDGLGVGNCGAQVQECWEFEHPRKDPALDARGLPFTNSHNTRSAKLRFYIPHAGVLHGLAGYFEAVLYGNVGLSIHPHRKDQISKDMLSWFPLFFPFKEPLYLPSNSELHVSIWRRTNERKVWYEWYAESFLSVGMLSPLSVLTYATKSTSPLGNGSYTFPPPTSQPAPPSPLVDAVDSPRKDSVRMGDSANGAGIVKTGQTSLHNPGGRSSWIGL